ncbi:hypothetical protein [Rhodoplanes elegans]|uniref:hypothetical protein n=1 Tax=Rhodoplanes elegans TaxID=29408 RepID=UPI001FD111A5|nr:hypothetical protein [Rhodoplanes elegans]
MCDYSLQHVATRAAKVGDTLVTTKFNNSITRGFSEAGVPNVAVCILPGTELAFDHDVECDHALGFFPARKLRERVARFRQINMDNPYEHHDALEFPSGQVVLLTRLCEGQIATVLQLPAGVTGSEQEHHHDHPAATAAPPTAPSAETPTTPITSDRAVV